MQMVSHGLISGLLFLLVGVVYAKTGTRDLTVLRGLLNPARGFPIVGSLMILGVMASAGIPGMVGFISEFVVFRGSFLLFPTQTLLCMVGSGLTSVYFLLLVNRAFFGRLAVAPATDAVAPDVLLPRVGWQDRLPAVVLALVIVALGLQPHWLTRWSESTTCSHGADGHCRRPGAGPALGAGHSGCPPWPESTFALAPEGAAAHNRCPIHPPP
jgi:NAD(P)H-quinone oxidoreductase subunit 4